MRMKVLLSFHVLKPYDIAAFDWASSLAHFTSLFLLNGPKPSVLIGLGVTCNDLLTTALTVIDPQRMQEVVRLHILKPDSGRASKRMLVNAVSDLFFIVDLLTIASRQKQKMDKSFHFFN